MGTFGNEFFQNLVEQTNDLIIRIDTRWRLRYLSPSVTTLMAHNKSAHIGGHMLSLIHPADRRDVITALTASIACRASSASVEARTPGIHGDVQDIMWTVKGDRAECSINGTVVAGYNKADLVAAGKLKSLDGVYGIRFTHNVEAVVAGFGKS